MRIVISSGHGKYIRGAAGPPPWGLDEVDEARRVVERAADFLRAAGAEIVTYHDDVSHSQSENLDRIVDFHNAQGAHDLDVSVHFNAYETTTTTPRGTECLYVTQDDLAAAVASEIALASGLIDRGPKYRSDLAFLNGTNEPAILIETCFCDSKPDVDIYRLHFESICEAISAAIMGQHVELPPLQPPETEAPGGALFIARGPCSWFGGPDDDGVAEDEGLAFIYDVNEAPHLFLPEQPPDTSGLARRLDPRTMYVACRWDYQVTPKGLLADQRYKALVRAGGREFIAYPADWGPHQDTGRVADLSPALFYALGLETDDVVEVIYPAP